MDQEIIRKLEAEAKRQQRHSGCHGYEHTERVIEICKQLGAQLGADMDILLPAAILHDIRRGEEDHAERSAIEAANALKMAGCEPEKAALICEAIRSHSFSSRRVARTLEAMILSDADKLDAMGAVGVYRTALYSGELKRPINEFVEHFYEKLFKLKDMLYTNEARLLAENRHRYMLGYLDEFLRELRVEA